MSSKASPRAAAARRRTPSKERAARGGSKSPRAAPKSPRADSRGSSRASSKTRGGSKSPRGRSKTPPRAAARPARAVAADSKSARDAPPALYTPAAEKKKKVSASNKYALKSAIKTVPAPKPARRVYTDDEVKELLAGFREVEDRSKWSEISPGTMVRYYEGGEFRFGGVLRGNYLGATDESKRNLQLETPFGTRNSWSVNLAKITRLFVKNGPTDELRSLVDDAIRKLNSHVQTLAKRSNELEARIAALERAK